MEVSKKYIWDYDYKKINLRNRQAFLWYLSRLVNTGQLSKISKKELKDNYKYLDIDPTLKLMIGKYYAK